MTSHISVMLVISISLLFLVFHVPNYLLQKFPGVRTSRLRKCLVPLLYLKAVLYFFT